MSPIESFLFDRASVCNKNKAPYTDSWGKRTMVISFMTDHLHAGTCYREFTLLTYYLFSADKFTENKTV